MLSMSLVILSSFILLLIHLHLFDESIIYSFIRLLTLFFHSPSHSFSFFITPQVTLARVARERRHIRNNLPLRGVLVIAANKDDIEALEYLKGVFWCCAVLCCAVLCCAVLYCTVLYCAVCAILCYIILYCVILRHVTLCSTTACNSVMLH